MNYLRGGLGVSRPSDEVENIAKPLTPKSERRTMGTLQISMQTSRGLCLTGRKCVRHEGHADKCWPAD